MDLSFLLSISSHSLRHSLPRLGACWLWPLGFSPMILLNSWELKTDLEEIVETLFFWESQPTYLKEGKPVVWIRKKIRSWILFSSSDMTQSWTLRTQRLSYQHQSVLCLSQKSQKRNFVRWSIYETSIHSKLQDRFQGHYYFSICVQSVKVYTVASSGPGTQFSESFKNASTFFFFRMESLELQAPGSSPIMLRLRQSDWYYSLLRGFNKAICKKSLTFCPLVFRTFCHPPFWSSFHLFKRNPFKIKIAFQSTHFSSKMKPFKNKERHFVNIYRSLSFLSMLNWSR